MLDPLNILLRICVKHPFPGPIRPISLLFILVRGYHLLVSLYRNYRGIDIGILKLTLVLHHLRCYVVVWFVQ